MVFFPFHLSNTNLNLRLFFLFSVTVITLLLPTTSDINFNTSSVFEGKKHSNKVSTTDKERNLKVDDVFTACDRRKNCSSSFVRRTLLPRSDGVSANVARLIYTTMKVSLAATVVIVNASANGTACSTGRCNSTSPTPFYVTPQPLSLPPRPLPTPPYITPRPLSSPPSKSPPILSPQPTLLPPRTWGPAYSYKGNLIRKIIIGVASAVMGGFMICIIICCFRYKSLARPFKFFGSTKSNQDIEAFLKIHGAVSQKRYKFSEVKKMTNSFKVKLGQGGFGAVYEGKLPTGCPVAIKILNASKGSGEDFINEVASISRTSHVNIVTLLGFCLEGRKKALIYEFMANGSLEKFIYKGGPETIASLSWKNLYQISIGIARGLEYLHRGCNTRILHFDIKPHNILLDENFCPKISDFGLAKLCPRKESIISMSNTRGTMGYVAPEMCNRHFGGVSHKSDVYSYGMMLLEMVGGRKNINAEASHTSQLYFPYLVYRRLELDNDLRPDEVMTVEENEIAKRMTIVGLWCIQTFPNDRPTMSKVIDMLEGSMNSLEIPPKPMFSSPTRSVTESSS